MRWLISGRTEPVLVEIAPTGYCNAKCPWCFFNDKVSNKRIRTKVMINALSDMARIGVKAVNWTGGGEPTLHPDFGDFVYHAAMQGLKQGLFTNGYRKIPNQKCFEWIRISLTDKGFKAIKKPGVPFGICLNHTAEHTKRNITDLCIRAKDFGARYFQIRPALVGDHDKQPYLFDPAYLKEYEEDNFKVHITHYKYEEAIKPKTYPTCYGYHLCPSIDWTGKVSVCLYLSHDPKYILGDLNRKSFKSIWPSIIKSVRVSDKCQNCCKNHEINKALYAARHIQSVDFL